MHLLLEISEHIDPVTGGSACAITLSGPALCGEFEPMLKRAITDEERGTCLEAAFHELAAIYEHTGREGLPADGGRLLDLEEIIASRPAESPHEAIMRVRALIAMREAEGGLDDTLLTGLCSVLSDLIRFGDRYREL